MRERWLAKIQKLKEVFQKLKEVFQKLIEEIGSDHAINPHVEKNIRALSAILLVEEECGAGVLYRTAEISYI